MPTHQDPGLNKHKPASNSSCSNPAIGHNNLDSWKRCSQWWEPCYIPHIANFLPEGWWKHPNPGVEEEDRERRERALYDFLKNCMVKLGLAQFEVKEFRLTRHRQSWPLPKDISQEVLDRYYAEVREYAKTRKQN